MLLLLLLALLLPMQQGWAAPLDSCADLAGVELRCLSSHCAEMAPPGHCSDTQHSTSSGGSDPAGCDICSNCCGLPAAMNPIGHVVERGPVQHFGTPLSPTPFAERPERPQWIAQSTWA